ncbi:hypothetical protein IWQ61_007337 [Dispira simplex]|nr:hypothetical protein IWQ61_007337 [Dispira simplex]
MRAFIISAVTLSAYCAITPVSSKYFPPVNPDPIAPSPGPRRPAEYKGPDLSKIVAKHPDLGNLNFNIVYFAFCSQTGSSSCTDGFGVAHTEFWETLKYKINTDGAKKGVNLLIEKGDATYVRLLFADGTIFCKKSDGTYTEFIPKFSDGQARANYFHHWAYAITFNQEFFSTVLQKYIARFKFDQEIKELDKVERSVAGQGYTSCYDVSMRDGLDALIKWAVRGVYKGDLKASLDVFKPKDRFHNFILGSLYDAILVNNDGTRNILAEWVDCKKVEGSYKQFCEQIQSAVKKGAFDKIDRSSTVLNLSHLSYDRNHSSGNVTKDIGDFDRRNINPAWLLD